jgi:hypothetical protein
MMLETHQHQETGHRKAATAPAPTVVGVEDAVDEILADVGRLEATINAYGAWFRSCLAPRLAQALAQSREALAGLGRGKLDIHSPYVRHAPGAGKRTESEVHKLTGTGVVLVQGEIIRVSS